MPFADRTFDAVTCVFLFHELPKKVRKQVALEIGRVLKPGGRLVLVDSLQAGDKPLYDPLLAAFPKTFHEPYYADYTRTDLAALFAAAGLRHASTSQAFLSKVAVFDKV
jgi:ubiquinone/menaquinone biosynthesis C-methylase UbiE